jgi:hypothetical protein
MHPASVFILLGMVVTAGAGFVAFVRDEPGIGIMCLVGAGLVAIATILLQVPL